MSVQKPAQSFLWLGLAMVGAFASCGFQPTPPSSSANQAATSSAPPLLAPETVPELENVELTTLVEGLEHPWGLAWLPNGDLLITERPGRLRIVRKGQLDPNPIAGLPPILVRGQAGLLDIAIHPQFDQNRYVYLTYSAGTMESNQVQVARGQLEGDRLTNVDVIFSVKPSKSGAQHFGSRLTWLPDQTLLVAIGDGGNPPVELDGQLIRHQAQKRDSGLGKIHRINDDGSIPANNPFRNQADAQPSLWSYGHRNIQGIALDAATNQVWSTEHGSQGGDELNRIEAGQNYGWPLVTFSREYTGGEITPFQTKPGYVDPKVVWTPAIAPSGLTVYQGDRVPAWQGKLFAGGLVSRDVRVIDRNSETQTIQNTSRISIGSRVRDVRQGPDGWLYVLTDEPAGRLIQVRSTAP